MRTDGTPTKEVTMSSPARWRIATAFLVVALSALTLVSLVGRPNDAGAAQASSTTAAFERAANSQGAKANTLRSQRAVPVAAAVAGARALAGTPAFRAEVGNVARAAGLGSVARDVVGALFGSSVRAKTMQGSDAILDGAAK
jgi:hypothetical protein